MAESKFSCACDDLHVNANVARANAFFVMFFIVIFALTQYSWVIFILIIDFAIKSFIKPKYAISSTINRYIVNNILKLKPRLIYAAPKIFAARIGLTFTVAIALTNYLGAPIIALILTIILFAFAVLEGFFEFCMGCWFYSLLGLGKKAIENPAEE